MRLTSAARAKENVNGRSQRAGPQMGTKLREVHDFFLHNRGIPVKWSWAGGGGQLYALQDFYGLDIRRIRHGVWVLAGEWIGDEYRDYIAQRVCE
jgi:hypothetical protein